MRKGDSMVDIEFVEQERSSMMTSSNTKTALNKGKEKYVRSRTHGRVNSISGLTSFETNIDSGLFSHRKSAASSIN